MIDKRYRKGGSRAAIFFDGTQGSLQKWAPDGRRTAAKTTMRGEHMVRQWAADLERLGWVEVEAFDADDRSAE